MGLWMIHSADEGDAAEIAAIYNHYVLNTAVSFEEEAVSEEEMRARIRGKIGSYPWIVLESVGPGREILGYAYAGPWKERAAYRHTLEDTIYVKAGETGRGIGRKLLKELLEELAKGTEVHALMAVIALPNEASVRLHEEFGFEKAAHFTEVGRKFGTWIDVGYWELIPGRRG